MKMLRRLLIIACPLFVGACAVPLPLQIATWAADGISYLLTSKSMSDHGLSAAVGQDCAVHPAITEGTVCREDTGRRTVVAASEALSGAVMLVMNKEHFLGFSRIVRSSTLLVKCLGVRARCRHEHNEQQTHSSLGGYRTPVADCGIPFVIVT